jgi:hypothetical protein
MTKELKVRNWRLTERDRKVLRWVAEQYTVPRDVLALLLARLSDDEVARAAGRVTDTVVDRTLRRWRELGLAHCRRFIVDDVASVWATRGGMIVAGIEYRPSEPTHATVAHRHAVARVRAHDEAAYSGIVWICERDLREGLAGRPSHLPDGVVEWVDDTEQRRRTAVEVELTRKTEMRVIAILRMLLARYDDVVYYATRDAGAVVRRARQEVDGGTGRVHIKPYPPMEQAEAV